jgi:hypothetical protein
MAENNDSSNNPLKPQIELQFEEEIEIEEGGFSFRPIEGFELEIDGSAYLYSEDGNIEIFLHGGVLENETSIAELNDTLAQEFLDNMDEFKLVSTGTETIQGITGFLNEIRFFNAEEEGAGKALICSPHLNQYFFVLGIAATDYWQAKGQEIFDQLLSKIHFHAQLTADLGLDEDNEHPDLTIEIVEALLPDEDFILTIEREDISLLLAARTQSSTDEIAITEILEPTDQKIYRYDPLSGDFQSQMFDHPLVSRDGEVCVFLPCAPQKSLSQGEYRFSFATHSGCALQEVQTIIRSGRTIGPQKIDLNFWLALENELFSDPEFLDQFEAGIAEALEGLLNPFDLILGEIDLFHPAPDELGSFAEVNIDTDLVDCSYIIAESFSNGRALNIGLVEKILTDEGERSQYNSALSAGSPGMILASASPHACILAEWETFKDDIEGLARAIIQQLIVFCGICNLEMAQSTTLNHDIAWQLSRHPIFYPAE